MSYNMKKMDWDNWKNLKSIANYNQRKIIFHPLYNKKKFVKEIYKSQMNKDLDLSNAFLFAAAMEDPETCQIVLEIILGTKLPKVNVHTEHIKQLKS